MHNLSLYLHCSSHWYLIFLLSFLSSLKDRCSLVVTMVNSNLSNVNEEREKHDCN